MKKILGLLGALVITSSTSGNVLSNVNIDSITSQNYLQKQNIKLKESYCRNCNNFGVWYRFLTHNYIIVRIRNDTWKNIVFKHDIYQKETSKFKTFLFKLFKDFPKSDHTGAGGSISDDDIQIAANIIVNNWFQVQVASLLWGVADNVGAVIRTDRGSYFPIGDSWWGAHINNGEW